jgi:hypothetical protein
MEKVVPVANLALSEEDIKSDLVDDSFHKKKGMFIQFLNQGCPGTPMVIGGIRINCSDIRRAPAYLSRNRRLIKQHATRCLIKHFQDMQSGAGANEALTIDDFGMTFSVASVSQIGATLNPSRRQEGPMFFCHFPALVEATTLVHADWNNWLLGESMHVINAYISLLPTHQRRHVLISKAKEEAAAAQSAAASLVQASPAKKPKAGPVASNQGSTPPNQRYTQPPRVSQEDQMREELANLRRMVQRLQSQALPNPPLPATKPPVWPSKDQGPDLPDDF